MTILQSNEPTDAMQTQDAGRMPNFLIIGAARSGTTTLHYVLDQHPQIYMSPNKETNFFSYYCSGGQVPLCTRLEDIGNVDSRSTVRMDDYQRLFRGVSTQIRFGESSPSYLVTAGVPEAVRSLIPQAKLIAILRQPIDKAYSHFMRKCQAQLYRITDDFGAVLEQDEARIKREGRGISFLGHGRYHDYLRRYHDVFGPDQLKVCLFDDMEERPEEFYADIFRFLGVDESFRADTGAKFNQSGAAQQSMVARLAHASKPIRRQVQRNLPPALLRSVTRWWHQHQSRNVEKPVQLSPALRRALTERYYRDEIAKLEGLIGRDLSHWFA
jgi:hypothetical protein